jgi:CRP-like cAMP-binding protein
MSAGCGSGKDLCPIRCHDCPVGVASGAGEVLFCPFIIRRHRRGEVLCLAGEAIEHVWFVKEGVVALGTDPGDVDQLRALKLPGSFIGLEAMIGENHMCTARALTPVTLCGATREGFQRWARENDERMALVARAALADPLLVESVTAANRVTLDEALAASGAAADLDEELEEEPCQA